MKDILLNKKNLKVFGIAALVTLLALSSFSYAYFIGSIGGSASTDVDVTTSVNERLVFTEGNPISINATLDNFSDGDGSLTGETTTNVRLNAGSQSSTATELYQVYYQIETNNFEYSVNENTPELILTITDPEGNVLSSVELADGTVLSSESVTTLVQDAEGNPTSQTVTGFDITTLEGLIFLSEDYEITNTTPTVPTEQNWTAKITFINLDSEQTVNEGKILNSNFMFVEEGLPLNFLILNNNGGKTAIEAETAANPPDFSQIADTNEGMFATPDDYGTSYYFRGAVDNNWVSFAGFYWRIVRVNGDGSVKLIYSGSIPPDESQKIIMLDGTHIGITQFNSSSNLAERAAYISNTGVQHGLTGSSTAKRNVDSWYENNILNSIYHAKVADNLFCIDRTSTGSGVGSSNQTFGSYIRNITNKNPSLKCPDSRDKFTVTDTINGNGSLIYPVALLSIDEAAMSGSVASTKNENNYLRTNSNFWTVSPSHIAYSDPRTMVFYSSGSLGGNYIHDTIYSPSVLRPVLSIISTAVATGSGTWNDPYIVL